MLGTLWKPSFLSYSVFDVRRISEEEEEETNAPDLLSSARDKVWRGVAGFPRSTRVSFGSACSQSLLQCVPFWLLITQTCRRWFHVEAFSDSNSSKIFFFSQYTVG